MRAAGNGARPQVLFLSDLTIHSRHTVRTAAMITGPTNRPTSPKLDRPPKIPTKANRKGRRAVLPTRVGQTKWSPASITRAPQPNTRSAAPELPPLTDHVTAAAA